jgi:hypothetical protein
MVANRVASKWIFETIKLTIDAVKFFNTVQLSPFECNRVYRCVLPHY